jgi:peptide methionine sulfoxide reductase MsrA
VPGLIFPVSSTYLLVLSAEASKRAIEESKHSDQPIATEIVAGGPFYAAEECHQD